MYTYLHMFTHTHTHTHGGQKFFSLLDSQNPSIGPPFSRITEHSHKARLVQACLPRLLVTVYQGLQTVLIASFMLNYFEKISQPCLKVVELFLSTLNQLTLSTDHFCKSSELSFLSNHASGKPFKTMLAQTLYTLQDVIAVIFQCTFNSSCTFERILVDFRHCLHGSSFCGYGKRIVLCFDKIHLYM